MYKVSGMYIRYACNLSLTFAFRPVPNLTDSRWESLIRLPLCRHVLVVLGLLRMQMRTRDPPDDDALGIMMMVLRTHNGLIYG
jgi:hypothetical protein